VKSETPTCRAGWQTLKAKNEKPEATQGYKLQAKARSGSKYNKTQNAAG
jgi:hypothetical protein